MEFIEQTDNIKYHQLVYVYAVKYGSRHVKIDLCICCGTHLHKLETFSMFLCGPQLATKIHSDEPIISYHMGLRHTCLQTLFHFIFMSVNCGKAAVKLKIIPLCLVYSFVDMFISFLVFSQGSWGTSEQKTKSRREKKAIQRFAQNLTQGFWDRHKLLGIQITSLPIMKGYNHPGCPES